MDGDEVTPIATTRLGSRQTNDFREKQFRPIFQTKLSGSLGQPLALRILLVEYRSCRAEDPQRPIAVATGTQNLAAGRIGAVGSVGKDPTAHASRMEIPDETRGRRMANSRSESPTGVIG